MGRSRHCMASHGNLMFIFGGVKEKPKPKPKIVIPPSRRRRKKAAEEGINNKAGPTSPDGSQAHQNTERGSEGVQGKQDDSAVEQPESPQMNPDDQASEEHCSPIA